MPIAELVSGLQVAGNMAKALVGIRDANLIADKVTDLRNAIFEAQSVALAAQSEQLTLINRVRDLEAQIVQMETWEAEKQRYELKKIRSDSGDAFAYVYKATMDLSQPDHQICANCYNRGEKSLLQTEVRNPGMAQVLVCHNCGADIYVNGFRHSEHSGTKAKSRR